MKYKKRKKNLETRIKDWEARGGQNKESGHLHKKPGSEKKQKIYCNDTKESSINSYLVHTMDGSMDYVQQTCLCTGQLVKSYRSKLSNHLYDYFSKDKMFHKKMESIQNQ